MEIAPNAIAIEFILAAASESGNASIRLAANGAMRSRGYAGKIQIGVIVCMGNVLICCQYVGESRIRMEPTV